MRTRPVEWHESNLKNRLNGVNNLAARVKFTQDQLERQVQEYMKLKEQIERAKREGKDSFDEERYNVPRT